MDLEGLTRKLNFVSGPSTLDDDFVDRMNSWWSCVILIMCTVIVSTRQYVGMPISCWFPQEFHKSWKKYGANYCWIKNTYFVAPDEDLPKDFDVRRHSELAYYQWVPYFLMCLALLFYLPKTIWRLCNWQTGINVQSIVTMACDTSNIEPEKRKGNMQCLATTISEAIARIERTDSIFKRVKQMGSCFATRAPLGRHLTSLYLFIKLLYVLNILAQFWILKSFIGTKYIFYGFQMLNDLIQGHEWERSGHFPRVTMCDFSIRDFAQGAHNFTVQCVLTINLFNEKVFILLWFWFAIMLCITIYSLIRWVYTIFSFGMRKNLIRNYLKTVLTKEKIIPSGALHDFVSHTLQMDGVFLLRLIHSNAGDVMAACLTKTMWENYLDERKEKNKGNGPDAASLDTPIYDQGTFV
jgi:innexin